MRFLEKIEIDQIVARFETTCELYLESSMQIEPDAFLYKLADKTRNRYGLLCRDYMQDDESIETRILSQEHSLIVLSWIHPIDRNNDYRVLVTDFDDFTYMFALFEYEEKF